MSPLYGKGIIESLGLVLNHFVESYLVDFRDFFSKKNNKEKIKYRSSSQTDGLFTVEYPEMKLAIPEDFRYIPFLVYDITESGEKKQRCTACGTCARVCPPQCIWIERGRDAETGRPKATPTEFKIDTFVCMNCGICAEYCPFDAIRMDHDYELASLSREDQIFDLEKLSKPASYYQEIRPIQYAREAEAREAKAKPH